MESGLAEQEVILDQTSVHVTLVKTQSFLEASHGR
jgi:hypothetical protein